MPRVSSHFSIQSPRLGSLEIQMWGPVLLPDSAWTITAAQLMGGLMDSVPTAGRAYTLPSAAALCEAIGSPMVNHGILFNIRNWAASALTLTIGVGAGGTLDPRGGNFNVTQNQIKEYLLMFTNVTVGSEAYTLYDFGSSSLTA